MVVGLIVKIWYGSTDLEPDFDIILEFGLGLTKTYKTKL